MVSYYSQGIINNGGHIVIAGAGQIYIDGGAAGGYLSQNGGIIDPSNAGVITMEGNWTNNSANTGFSTDDGTVIFNGANQSIDGTNSTTFVNLTLQGSGVKTQSLNTFVGGVSTTTGVLSVGNVIYDLNSNILTITNPLASGVTSGTGYILSEVNAAINPSIMRWNMGISTGAHIYPFGVAGLQIPFTFNKTTAGASDISVSTRATAAADNAPWAGLSNVGGVTFFYCPNLSLSGNPCAVNSVIDRWWDITPTAAVTANVTFSYRGIENTLNAPYNTNNIGAQWWDGTYWNQDNATTGSAAAVSVGVGNVTALALSTFCPYVLSSVLVPLPVDLLQMSVNCEEEGILLTWLASSKASSKFFIVEKSLDGEHFSELGRVNASEGNNHQYSFTDNLADQSIINYYRIKEIDHTDLAKNHKVVSSELCKSKTDAITILNSTNGEAFVIINAKQASTYSIQLVDMLGRILKTETLSVEKGINKNQIKIADYHHSVYIVKVLGNNIQKSQKVVLHSN